MVVLGLCCCTQAFSSCNEWGLLFLAMLGLLIVVAFLITDHVLMHLGFSNRGAQT